MEFLDPRGRSSFREFWTTAIICLVAAALPLTVLALDGVANAWRLVSLGAVWIIMGVMWIAAIRRLHDSDDRAAWVFWTMGGPTVLLFGWVTLPAFGVFPPMVALAAITAPAALLTYAGHRGMLATSGTRPNRYGPPTARPLTKQDRRRFRGLSRG